MRRSEAEMRRLRAAAARRDRLLSAIGAVEECIEAARKAAKISRSRLVLREQASQVEVAARNKYLAALRRLAGPEER